VHRIGCACRNGQRPPFSIQHHVQHKLQARPPAGFAHRGLKRIALQIPQARTGLVEHGRAVREGNRWLPGDAHTYDLAAAAEPGVLMGFHHTRGKQQIGGCRHAIDRQRNAMLRLPQADHVLLRVMIHDAAASHDVRAQLGDFLSRRAGAMEAGGAQQGDVGIGDAGRGLRRAQSSRQLSQQRGWHR